MVAEKVWHASYVRLSFDRAIDTKEERDHCLFEMELVSRNVLRHVYGVLQARKRLADTDNISNLQLFYNRIMSEYSAQKKGQCLVVPLTGQDVDDFYSHRMSREDFVEIIRTKVSQAIAWIATYLVKNAELLKC